MHIKKLQFAIWDNPSGQNWTDFCMDKFLSIVILEELFYLLALRLG